MSTQVVETPFQFFTDANGLPLESGHIYIGVVDLNPETNPVSVFWDFAQTIPAAQPIRTLNGYPVRNGSAATVYVGSEYSLEVKDKNQALVFSHLNSAETNPEGMAADGAVPMTGGLNLAQGADVVAANALVLGTDGNSFDITGTTTITSIGTLGVGTFVTLQFDEVLTITHHATDLVLPNGANIVTKAGDICTFYEYATGDWRLVASNIGGTKGSDVASAAALPVINDGDFFNVTGTTTITSINSIGVGAQIVLQFDGALILTHHATNLILPGGANITTAAGDVYTFREYASGDWVLVGQGMAISATTVTTAGIVSVDDTTESTSPTTGSIHTDGGLGVAKRLNVGTTLSVGTNSAATIGQFYNSEVATTIGTALLALRIRNTDTTNGNLAGIILDSENSQSNHSYSIYTKNAGLHLAEMTTDRFVIASGGNVGIGTGATTPEQLLHVKGANAVALIHVQGAGVTWALDLGYDNTGNTAGYIYNRLATPGAFLRFGFGTTMGSGDKMTIDNDGNVDIVGGVDAGSNGTFLKTKVIDIGDWNMDTTASVNVAHGLTLGNIRSIDVKIRDDDGVLFDLVSTSSGNSGSYSSTGSANIVLRRVSGLGFDNTSFDSTSYNRGWVTIVSVA